MESKVSGPQVRSRIEQSDNPTRFTINRGDVASFESIAREARPSEILQIGRTAVFASQNVINLMSKAGVVFV
jgi:hypothetical protein